jgi:exopolysaccharide production protein ExoQ
MLLINKRKWLLKKLLSNIFPILFLLLLIFSFFWSVNPSVTLRRAIAGFGMLAVGLLLNYVAEENADQKHIYLPLIIGMLVSYAFVIFIPSIGVASGQLVPSHNGLWQGIYGFKNALGQIIAILCIFIVVKISKKIYLFYFSIAVFMLLMTKSTSSIIAFFAAISFWQFISLYKFKSKILALGLLSFLIFLTLLIVLNIEFIVYEIIGKDFTGSGRVDIWRQVYSAIGDRSLGYGYGGVFWGETSIAYDYMDEFYTNLGHSHNGFVDVQLEIGIAGLILYCLCLVYPLCRLCFKLKKRNPMVEVQIMLIVFLFVYSFSGSSFMRPNTLLFMFFFYTSFDILREKNERLYSSK